MTSRGSELDDEIEKFAESLRIFEDHRLTGELSKLYHDLKSLDHGSPSLEKDGQDEDQDENGLAITKRKIGALEEEIGRRKKEGVWTW